MNAVVERDEFTRIALAIDDIPDSLPIWDAPIWVRRRILETGGSTSEANLAAAIVRLAARTRGHR